MTYCLGGSLHTPLAEGCLSSWYTTGFCFGPHGGWSRLASAPASLTGYEVATEVTEARVLQEGQNSGRRRQVDVGAVSVPVLRDSYGPLVGAPRVSMANSTSWVLWPSHASDPTRTSGRCLFPCCFPAASKR